MSQEEVINYLKKNKRGTAREISNKTKMCYSCVSNSLRKMRRFNEIKWIKFKKRNVEEYIYFYK